MKRTIAVLFFICSAFAVFAQTDLPETEGFISDFAKVLTDAEKQRITEIAENLEKSTTAELAVVTVTTVKPFTIEEYSVRLFEKWGIGKKAQDNGVLLVVAVEDREMKIEVGYGLEGILPDGLCGEIIRNSIIPEFKNGNYGSGITAGAEAIAGIVGGKTEYKPEKPAEEVVTDVAATGIVFFIKKLLFPIIVLFFVFGIFSKPRKRTGTGRSWHWTSGSSWGGHSSGSWGSFGGGSFGGFGGGSSGGGGAVGRW